MMHPYWKKQPLKRLRSREPANQERPASSLSSVRFRRSAYADLGFNAAHRGGRTRAKTSYPPVNVSEVDSLHRLHGRAFPSAPLRQPDGANFTVDSALLGWVAIYFYPGTHATPVSGCDGPAEDAAQHRAFKRTTWLSVRLGLMWWESAVRANESNINADRASHQPSDAN